MNNPIKAQSPLRSKYRMMMPLPSDSATIDAKMNVSHGNRRSTTPEGASQEPEAGDHQ